MSHIGSFETPDRRLARLRTQLDSTTQSMGDTVTDLVDLEARRRTMEDNLRRFRQIERQQQFQVTPTPQPRPPLAAQVTPTPRPSIPRGDARVTPAPLIEGEQTAEVGARRELLAQGLNDRQVDLVIRSAQAGERVPEALFEAFGGRPGRLGRVAGRTAEIVGAGISAADEALFVANRFINRQLDTPSEQQPFREDIGLFRERLTEEQRANLRGVPLVGPALEREVGFLSTPAGLAASLAFPTQVAAGAGGGIAAATAAQELGAGEDVQLAAQIAGNVFVPGGGLVPAAAVTRPAAVGARAGRQLVGEAAERARLAPELGGPLRGGEELGGFPERFTGRARRLEGGPAREVHVAKADPSGAPPRRPPPVAGGATPDGPQFDAILDAAIKGEKPDQALMRRHQGVIDARSAQLSVEVTENNKELVKVGLGQNFRGSVVARTEGSFDELNSLLHNPGAVARGERIVPNELRPIYDKLRAQTDFEQAARIDFNPDQALVEDYFFRGWKPPEGMFTGSGQRGALGRNPAFKLPRVDATYDEMFEAGFRPMFENPAEQARYSQLMGIKYREQSRLVEKMQALELALPVKGGPVPEGWRVPKVGPAFEGKPYAEGAKVSFTRQWAVTDSMANRLENIYGKTPRLGKGEIFGKTVDFQKAVDALTFLPKRAKLVGSVFQHLDFLSRSHIGAWTGFVDAIRRGDPAAGVVHLAKWPKSAVEIVHSTFSPGARARLAKLGIDPKPLWKDRQISNLMLREEGLSLRDPTLGIDLDDVIRQVKAEPRIVRLGKFPIRALDALERQWRQGLFQGTYPAAILSDVKNNIGPMILRQHPEATDRQLAGMIATAANKLYSVIPESQSVIQNKQARWFLTRFLFSLGENEGLLRSFTGAIRGENAALFRTRLVGTYLGLMALAGTIHFASTGKPLPLDRFVPVSKDKFGPLPFGYNTDFASPTLPIKGRGGVDIELDLVMQQDTIFRILDPKSFLNARFSVPVSSLRNQAAGTDFFGAPINTVGPGGVFSRTSQLVQDLFAPIGAGQAGLEILRNNVEETEGLITPGEGRLGTAGLGIQAGGVNLRAERTPELLDRIRAEVLRDRGIQESYGEIATTDLPLKAEIDIDVEERIGAELEVRGETAELRGQQTPQTVGFEALEATRERQQAEQLTDDAQLNSDRWTGDVWRERYADRQREFFASREQIREDFQITFNERESPSKSVNAAIDAYFDVNIDEGTFNLPDGTIDWDAFFDARDATLRPLSSTDRARVVQWLRKFDTPTVTEFRRAKDIINRMFDTPKYKDLTLAEGEEADRILNEDVPNLQAQALREGIELERTDAVHFILERDAVSEEVKAWLQTRFKKPRAQAVKDILRDRLRAAGVPTDIIRRIVDRPGPKLETLVNPERDTILIENQEILAKFYPDILARQLNREQEAGLGETAFAAVQR